MGYVSFHHPRSITHIETGYSRSHWAEGEPTIFSKKIKIEHKKTWRIKIPIDLLNVSIALIENILNILNQYSWNNWEDLRFKSCLKQTMRQRNKTCKKNNISSEHDFVKHILNLFIENIKKIKQGNIENITENLPSIPWIKEKLSKFKIITEKYQINDAEINYLYTEAWNLIVELEDIANRTIEL